MPFGILFDMDGVLVDSGAAHLESWQLAACRRGLNIAADEFKRSFGQRSPDIIRTILGSETGDDEVRQFDSEKEAAYRELIAGDVPLMPGCRDLLTTLMDAEFSLAVASSGPPENIELVLREGDLARYFSATVTAIDIQHGKPAPDCFLLAAERIGCLPADCVVIEDAPVGIRAGVAAGMPVLALCGTHSPAPLVEAGAATVIHSLGEITPALIRDLLARA